MFVIGRGDWHKSLIMYSIAVVKKRSVEFSRENR